MATPQSLADVDHLSDNTAIDVIGLVVDALPPAMTSGRSM